MEIDACSIFLQVPTEDENSFTLICTSDFLNQMSIPSPDSLKVLKVPALREYDINLESITDLIGERR